MGRRKWTFTRLNIFSASNIFYCVNINNELSGLYSIVHMDDHLYLNKLALHIKMEDIWPLMFIMSSYVYVCECTRSRPQKSVNIPRTPKTKSKEYYDQIIEKLQQLNNHSTSMHTLTSDKEGESGVNMQSKLSILEREQLGQCNTMSMTNEYSVERTTTKTQPFGYQQTHYINRSFMGPDRSPGTHHRLKLITKSGEHHQRNRVTKLQKGQNTNYLKLKITKLEKTLKKLS